MNKSETIASKIASGVQRALFGNLASNLIDWRWAQFADKNHEKEYKDYLVDVEVHKDRLVNFAGIGIYYAFGILDFLTFNDHQLEVLILRWGICGPLAIAIVALSFSPRFKKHFMIGTASVMLIGALSVITMIGMAPREGAPPYIIGVFAIFILFACIQRLRFATSIAIYVVSFAFWAITVSMVSPKSNVEVLSGYFFFAWISTVSGATAYSQEIRSRLDFFRLRQRQQDAAYIQQLLIEATAADRSKINFLSILSHELRTPLHQIIGFAQVLETNPIEKSTEYLGQINDSARQLLTRISKMLRYADATAGRIRYELEPTDTDELLQELLGQNQSSAQNASVNIKLDAIEPAKINIDASHTIYALSNIIENAIRASASGTTVSIAGRMTQEGGYAVTISDAGCGMTEQQLRAAFQPFSIAEEVRTRTLEGVGLGLTLAEKILTDQNASMKIESTVGVGTTVRIVFSPNQLAAPWQPAPQEVSAAS